MMMIVTAWNVVLSYVVVTMALKEEGDSDHPHEILELPNYSDKVAINFKQYSGHIELANKQRMFYWVVESEENPATDPLVLWLNGGPGCSSLGGFFTENGPFVVESDLSVKRNRYAWNRKTNMVFLESPSGVGFSSPQLPVDEYNDDTTTDRAYEFLELFFQEYTEYQNRPFYITGESYAGIYIPYLVHKLVNEPINNVSLTGYAIGNPYTDDIVDGNAYMDYYYTHGMISLENYQDMTTHCKNQIGRCMNSPVNCTDLCEAAVQEGVLAVDSEALNPYYIYGDVCLLQNNQAGMLHYRKVRPMHRGNIGPCTDKYTEKYLRLQSVQDAIHVSLDHIDWTDCNDFVAENYNRSSSSLQKYPDILKPGLKALIYSGDADSVVNFIGTERWITNQGLKLNIVDKWKAWFGPDKQLAGYTQLYDGLEFKTVKGAGHMVPAIRPLHGLYMFECFVFGNEACESFAYPKDNLEYITGEDLTVSNKDEDSDDSDDSSHPNAKPETVQQSSNGNNVAQHSSASGTFGIVLLCVVVIAVAAVMYKKYTTRQKSNEAAPLVGPTV